MGRGLEITLGVRVNDERSSGLAAGEKVQKCPHDFMRKNADTPLDTEVHIKPLLFALSAQSSLRVIIHDLKCPLLRTFIVQMSEKFCRTIDLPINPINLYSYWFCSPITDV